MNAVISHETTLTMMPPKNADQKSVTWNPALNQSDAIPEASQNVSVLITSRKRPSVMTIRQQESAVSTGLTNKFTIASTAAMIRMAETPRSSSMLIPGTIQAATQTDATMISQRTMKWITPGSPAWLLPALAHSRAGLAEHVYGC